MALDSGSSFAKWYTEEIPSPFGPAATVFDEARRIFERDGTNDPKKKKRWQDIQATSLSDILSAVDSAQKRYNNGRTGSKIRDGIQAFSQRVCYYGKVLDAMAQHHPEYVALAWGTMKLLLGAVVEHEKTGLMLTTALIDLADSLPRVELTSTLYPTNAMKRTVAILYAHIIRFLLRALEWYEEGSWKRAIHSFTKPSPLQYGDILDDIRRTQEGIAAQALSGSQAELRDVHKELIAIRQVVDTMEQKYSELRTQLGLLYDLVEDVKGCIAMDQAIGHSERMQLSYALSNIQSTQAIQLVSSQCTIDHHSALQVARTIRDRHLPTARIRCNPFWDCNRVKSWNQSSSSGLLTLKIPFCYRQAAQDFCTNIIDQLQAASVPILWVLKQGKETYYSQDILKSLIHQAICLLYPSQSEEKVVSFISRFVHAQLEEHHLEILADILQPLPVVYLIVQVEVLLSLYTGVFIAGLQSLIQKLSSRPARTVLKILILTRGPTSLGGTRMDSGVHVRKVPRRKASRVPKQPLNV